MSGGFIDESGRDISDIRPESLPGGADALELLDAAVSALGGQRRDGQRFMAAKVAEALETRRHLLVQAGTGTGKSLAYLIPALLHARSSEKPVVVATATLALQNQITGRDVPRLLDALEDELDERPDVALLKGRSNYACLHKVEGGYPEDDDALFSAPVGGGSGTEAPLGGLAQQVLRLREWVETTESGDRDDIQPGVSDAAWRQVSVTAKECLGRKCPLVEQCFAERARSQAGEADVVITNHALLAINAFEGLAVLPEHDVVVVDEAHELRDRVTGAVTASLSAAAVRAAATAVRKHTAASSDELERAAQAFDKAFDDDESGLLARGFTEEQVYAVRGVQDAARTGLSETKGESKNEDAGRHAARSRLSELLDTAERMLSADTAHDVLWISRVGRWSPTEGYVGASAGEPATLNIAPLSVAGPLREGLFDGRTVVLTSATLAVGSSFASVAGSLGLQGPGSPSWRGVDVGSPFDYRRQGILYVAKRLAKPGRGVSPEQLDELLELLEASGGGALGLFSSRRAAEDAAEALRGRTNLPILCQGDASLPSLVKDFTDDPAASLFGTMSLWQGVDVPGHSCRLVVIDRIPFPRPDDPLGTARTRAAERAGGNGFMTVSASHAAVRLAQGAGRLIRASGDRGVVAVLDSRLATARYGSFLARSLPPLWPTTDKKTVLGALERLSGA
ncbi:ATP-dependent helicase [Kocuria tytonicola]|uniref:ATP-dependent helicase DinG n=1 Tax=Kocuria tytonicola TaxID=2055946 RepID=A0A3L9LYP7_9MICC|nr:ATP-dependent DNA helicase [Kocuria tytonicola]RLY92397.1 ATP-dependent DNA helicase [Kocuria tytonicola]RLZ04211.1 ATP-dependent helicase [Kocuria tytonicola]